MSSSIITSLTPNQVNDELNKMQAFIRKEAEEKAKEIQLKADQEYEIEKTSIVRNETSNIDTNFEAKLKKLSLKQQITRSTIANKMRLKVLSAREESLNDIFDSAKEQLIELAKDETKYKPILKALILEALFRLLENKAVIRVTERDSKIVPSLLDDVKKQYKEVTKKDIEISVSKDYLNENIAGGLFATNGDGKIEVNNTLEERLDLLSQEALPAIRLEMFGPSKTRKFFD
ncbi:H(+)-transporting V1 sector ATPase subunit E NDAI_0H02600 [Naumovozyma dairenensis CBS 421]|uniref:V-type proton ATPase subunit E n=1 Tax=Naumovozyma dairenensis (strain ATCC 10597 / BCRC 20456 / CBS 421 / NBRC 0211 / NRRL Y-12639) TaxID=1071378 RepID=G0WF73_NAUDC|nr:hypothetical protein NDAI_0H02600 [Naumovozyma dairenensis CBS 421]CCD26434.1 hypothetical protein NDAI_0H02600 [Naumovozyma dairenensis CBS 421]